MLKLTASERPGLTRLEIDRQDIKPGIAQTHLTRAKSAQVRQDEIFTFFFLAATGMPCEIRPKSHQICRTIEGNQEMISVHGS